MHNRSFRIYFFVCACLLATSATAEEKPLYISLGAACTTSIVLKQLDLRQESYPFDWLISPLDSLIRAFDDDFAHFFTHLRVHPDAGGTDGLIDYYGLEFHHVDRSNSQNPGFNRELALIEKDLIFKDWHTYMPENKKTMQRRIDRFKNACLGNRKIYFIRSTATIAQGPITQSDAILLRDTIRKRYPHLDFCLLIIGNSEEYGVPWNLPDIKNYYGYPSPDTKWKETWEKILRETDHTSRDSKIGR